MAGDRAERARIEAADCPVDLRTPLSAKRHGERAFGAKDRAIGEAAAEGVDLAVNVVYRRSWQIRRCFERDGISRASRTCGEINSTDNAGEHRRLQQRLPNRHGEPQA